jgi:hypothetical protein
MSISALSYVTSGQISLAQTPFTLGQYLLDTSTGSNFVWEHDYRFDYVLNPPWTSSPSTYTTNVVYTVVER